MRHALTRIDGDTALPAQVDVAVIGAGIIGVCAAYEMAQRGLKVAILEKGLVAAEQSSRNWGWVRQQGRDRRELPLIVQSVRRWESLQNELGCDLGFRRRGLLSLTRSPAELARWKRWAVNGRAAGIEVRELDPSSADAALPAGAQPWVGGILTPTDGLAEPAKAVPAIAAAARRAGVTLLQETAVRALHLQDGVVRGVHTEHGLILADRVLLAAGAWSSLFLRHHGVRLPQLVVRSTVSRTGVLPETIPGTFCSNDFCLRRRQDAGYTLTLRGGERFDLVPDGFRFFFDFLPLLRRNWREVAVRPGWPLVKGLWKDRKRSPDAVSVYEQERIRDPAPDEAQVRRALRALRLLPEFARAGIESAWAGAIDMTPDLVPVIAPVHALPGLTVATGFSGHGFGIGPGAGILAADLVCQSATPLVDPTPFRLERFTDGTPLFIDPDVI